MVHPDQGFLDDLTGEKGGCMEPSAGPACLLCGHSSTLGVA